MDAALPAAAEVMAQAGSENFPVASRLLPRATRAHLLAIYGFARLVDDAGDEARGDRTELLDQLEQELERVWGGAPRLPVFVRLQPTVREFGLPIDPFRRLIEANRQDQVVTRYETFSQLAGYCELSANPVGELVLRIFAAATPERLELSNSICTALQVVEHCQDVAEDYRRGRVYLPAEDLERFGVREEDLGATVPTAAFRRLVCFELARVHQLLDQGAPLVRSLRGRERFAVAGFVAGGRAASEAIAHAGYDVLCARPRPSKALFAAHVLKALSAGGRR